MESKEIESGVLTPLAKQMHLSATLEINELVHQRTSKGCKVVHLRFGEATFPIQKGIAAAHRVASDITSCLPVAGLVDLREAIARFQSHRPKNNIQSGQVVVAPGSKPLLFALFQGDVLLPRPSWVRYEPQIIHAGKKLFWVVTDEENRHTIKVIPSNPTGQGFNKHNIEMISAFCESHGITLISDEIYSDISFSEKNSATPCSSSQFNIGHKILTGRLSKTYTAGGWRVGYAIFPANDFEERIQLAVLAYVPEMDLYRSKVVSLHKRCILALYHALRQCGLAASEPKGAFYVYPSFHLYSKQLEARGIRSSQELYRWLIEECSIAALPGSAFGEDDAGPICDRYRLWMATSYLYFHDHVERYRDGYLILDMASDTNNGLKLPLLDEAIQAIQNAVAKLLLRP
ncbi:pyridoxal phosphate-dependent transferase [Trichoderma austrokoningii]